MTRIYSVKKYFQLKKSKGKEKRRDRLPHNFTPTTEKAMAHFSYRDFVCGIVSFIWVCFKINKRDQTLTSI